MTTIPTTDTCQDATCPTHGCLIDLDYGVCAHCLYDDDVNYHADQVDSLTQAA